MKGCRWERGGCGWRRGWVGDSSRRRWGGGCRLCSVCLSFSWGGGLGRSRGGGLGRGGGGGRRTAAQQNPAQHVSPSMQKVEPQHVELGGMQNGVNGDGGVEGGMQQVSLLYPCVRYFFVFCARFPMFWGDRKIDVRCGLKHSHPSFSLGVALPFP